MGIVATGLALAVQKRKDLSRINEVQNNLLKQPKHVADNEKTIKKALERMEESLEKLSKTTALLSNEIKELKRTYPKTVYIISHIVSKKLLTKATLREFGYKGANGQFDPKILDVLNVTIPCVGHCPKHLYTPVTCNLDQKKNKLFLNFDARVVDDNSKILRSDPFTLLTENNPSQVCERVYNGPQRVIYNATSDCTAIVERSETQYNNGAMIVPNPIGCAGLNEKNTNDHHFSQTTCYTKPSVRERSLIQIKYLRRVNYIYCPSKKIEFFHIKRQCPNYSAGHLFLHKN